MSNPRRDASGSSSSDESGDDRRVPHRMAAAAGRRDETSISFRHFLQQSDVVPTRHGPITPGRSTRNAAAVDLVDIPGGLPDFVQDHLVMESQGVGGDASHDSNSVHVSNPLSPLDLGAVDEIMPAFSNNTSHRDLPNSGGDRVEEMGAYGPAPTGTPSSLPDFLSDGPMHYDATTANSMENSSTGGGRLPSRCTGSLGRSQSRDSSSQIQSLLQQIEILTNQLQQRDRRIAQMEATLESQNAELQRTYSQLAVQQSINRNNFSPAANSRGGGEGSAVSALSPSDPSRPQDVQAIATRAESLLAELMKEIQRLKRNDQNFPGP